MSELSDAEGDFVTPRETLSVRNTKNVKGVASAKNFEMDFGTRQVVGDATAEQNVKMLKLDRDVEVSQC